MIKKYFGLIVVGIDPSSKKPKCRFILQSPNPDAVPQEIGRYENEDVDANEIIVALIKKK